MTKYKIDIDNRGHWYVTCVQSSNAQDAYRVGDVADKYELSTQAVKRRLEYIEIATDWNGYGYNYESYVFVSEYQKNRKKLEKKVKQPTTTPVERWCRRLSKLTGESIEFCEQIANEKIADHQMRINETGWNGSRWYKKICRENPLRYIKDEGHAFAILSAHERHTKTDYEDKLEEAKELARDGGLDWENVRDYARQNYQKYSF